MAKIRPRRLGEEILRHLAEIIDRKVKDPRKGIITITNVRVSPDLSLATVKFTAVDFKGKSARDEAKVVLEHASGFIRHELAGALRVRSVPQLRFYYDDSLDKMEYIDQLIRQIHSDDDTNEDK